MRDQTGEEEYKMHRSARMERLFRAYASRKGVCVEVLRFVLCGSRVNSDDTPASLELNDGDQIDIYLEQCGSKPVILLYPEAPLDVTVALQLSPLWSFSALYPKPAPNKLAQASGSEVRHFVADNVCWETPHEEENELRQNVPSLFIHIND